MNISTSAAAGWRTVASIAAGGAVSLLVAIGVPLAVAAPVAAPPSDSQGYVDSTARCTKPDTAVVFGSTATSRIAICATAGGTYQYRGVRVSDGAKLIAPATPTRSGSFVISNDGATYTVTPTALSVTIGGNTVKTESWTDFHNQLLPTSSRSAQPSTGGAATAQAQAQAPATAPAPAPAPTTAAPAAPLPPPLPAEVGGGPTSLR